MYNCMYPGTNLIKIQMPYAYYRMSEHSAGATAAAGCLVAGTRVARLHRSVCITAALVRCKLRSRALIHIYIHGRKCARNAICRHPFWRNDRAKEIKAVTHTQDFSARPRPRPCCPSSSSQRSRQSSRPQAFSSLPTTHAL